MTWDLFDQLSQQLARGGASTVVEPLQALRRQWPEPALATLLADALAQLGRPDDALACLQADIEAGIANHWTHYTLAITSPSSGGYLRPLPPYAAAMPSRAGPPVKSAATPSAMITFQATSPSGGSGSPS